MSGALKASDVFLPGDEQEGEWLGWNTAVHFGRNDVDMVLVTYGDDAQILSSMRLFPAQVEALVEAIERRSRRVDPGQLPLPL
jgi:hypothetical protein